MKAGNKSDLVERIVNFDLEVDKIPSVKEKIDNFLKDTKKVIAEEKPPISLHYFSSFSAVERFGQHLGYAPFPHKVMSKNMLILINCLLIGANNSRSIVLDLSQQSSIEDTEESFKQYFLSLSNSLLE